jgi:hypothetical protein
MRDDFLKRTENGFFGFTPMMPDEVHAAYRDMDLRVEADSEGTVTLSGNFDTAGSVCENETPSSRLSISPPTRKTARR